MGELEENAASAVAEVARSGDLGTWARKSLSEDAQLVLRMMPYGGHVRVLEDSAGKDGSGGGFTISIAAGGGLVIGGLVDDDSVEPLTVREDQLVSFFRASGHGRVDSKAKTSGALAELLLRGLVRSFQGEHELARYSLTKEGKAVQDSLGNPS